MWLLMWDRFHCVQGELAMEAHVSAAMLGCPASCAF